jgi:hypothetical protein
VLAQQLAYVTLQQNHGLPKATLELTTLFAFDSILFSALIQ